MSMSMSMSSPDYPVCMQYITLKTSYSTFLQLTAQGVEFNKLCVDYNNFIEQSRLI